MTNLLDGLRIIALAVLWSLNGCSVVIVTAQQQQQQTTALYQPAAFQSGPDSGSSFAAAAVYVPEYDAVLFAGTTNGQAFQPPHSPPLNGTQGCFFATLALPNNSSSNLTFLGQQTFVVPDVAEVCTDILRHDERVLATGYAGHGGLLDHLYVPGGYTDVTQMGMVLDFVPSTSNTASALQYKFVGGHLMQQVPITYPVGLTSLPGDSVVYVAAMETSTTTRNDAVLSVVQDPALFLAYGTAFFMTVTKLSVLATSSLSATASVQESLQDLWRVPIATHDGQSVHVSGLQKLSDEVIVVVGTTAGQGAAFGQDQGVTTDLDGFVTKLNPLNGALVGSLNNTAQRSAAKINSVNDRDDWIMGMCYSDRDPHHIYVVGSTRGRMDATATGTTKHVDSIEAFCIKLEVERLIPIWTHQLGVGDLQEASTVRGISCTVTADGQSLYYGGVVENNQVLSLSGPGESYGGDDIFIAQLDPATGTMNYVRQLGSERNDALAVRGGLVTDAAGNAVVVGNTMGSFYRQRGSGESGGDRADVFVTTVARYNGAVVPPLRPAKNSHDAELDGTAVDHTNTNGENEGVVTSTNAPVVATDTNVPNDEDPAGGMNKSVMVGLMVAFLLGGICCCLYCVLLACDRGEAETDRHKVLGYLSEFDVDDVDLRHSATGGWHCSYSGALAQGICVAKSETRRQLRRSPGDKHELISPLTGTSVVSDDSYSHQPHIRGGLDDVDLLSNDLRPRRGDYTGLVDSYNSTWNEMAAQISRESLASHKQKRKEWQKDII